MADFRKWMQRITNGAAHVSTQVVHSSYQGTQTVGTTAISFAFAAGANGVKIRVPHATQTIKIGMGATAAEADANAALSIAYDINDKFVIENRASGVNYFSLLGSGAGTTVDLVQI